jgi:PAS domain S-box-containing protein
LATQDTVAHGALNFLVGGGEMGERIRSFDWASTSLGPPERWPQSLKTSIRIMLMSRQPVWIGWGHELIYFYNDPYFSIIGGKHPAALGKPTREVWHEIWNVIGPMLSTAMGGDEGTYVESQLLIMERNGYPEETYYTFSYSPIPDDEGRPGGIFCANSQDTERVIGQRELALLRDLAARTAKCRDAVEACERSVAALATDLRDLPFSAIYLVDEGGEAAVLQGAAGIEAGHRLAPQSLDSVFNWKELLRHQSPQVLDIKQGADVPFGDWGVPPSKQIAVPLGAVGESFNGGVLLVGLSPYRVLDEGYRGFLNLVASQIAAAIADAEAIERERRRINAMAELDRAKTAFFANVSHEFRTPLTLMLGPLQDVLSQDLGRLPARIRLELNTVRRNGIRLQKLVNSLLDFSRLEAGRMKAEFRPIPLAIYTKEIASAFASPIERADLRYEVDCQALDPTDYPYVDPDLWEKLVLNLISNAFKHTFEGVIRVSLRKEEGAIVFQVADTGIGIAPDDLTHLFERFRRVEGARARTHEGSGIGLALVQEVTKLHGGEISVESRVRGADHGTTFTVRLPVGYSHLPAEKVVHESVQIAVDATDVLEGAIPWLQEADLTPLDAAAESLETESRAAPVRSSGARIIVADDNADMRSYIARLLSDQYRIEQVADGQEAMDAIRRERPDMVLTDVMMPRMDGFELIWAIREDSEFADLPVIMLSARAGEESRIEGLDAGADDYLVKPFGARELIARVDSALALAKLRRESGEAIAKSEALLAAEKRALELITTGAPLANVLHLIATDAEKLSEDGMICSILILDESKSRLLHGAGPSLPDAYNKAIDGVQIGPQVGSCGTAAFRQEPVSVPKIENDPLWVDFRDLALEHDLRSCTSRPFFSSRGEILGTVAMYYRKPHEPNASDFELGERVARLAGIVIERDQALSLAEAERERLRNMFMRAPAIVCVLRGPEHVFELANPRYLELIGVEFADQLIGRKIREVRPEIAGQGFFEILDRVYETGEEFVGNEVLVRLDPHHSGHLEEFYMNIVYLPLRNLKGEVDGILVHAIDVSDQVQARRRIEGLAQELEELVHHRTRQLVETNEQLQGFTYSVAHDLRQQIRGINANASMVLLDKGAELEETTSRQLERMVGASRKLGMLVDDLLNYARHGNVSPRREPVNLSEVAKEIVEEIKSQGRCKDNTEFIIGASPTLECDFTMTRIMLENLLDNACKYSSRCENPKVEFGLDSESFFVRDNGIGFDMAFAGKLFRPFERLHVDESFPGTGIGLANVKRLLEKQGGRIWADAKPGEGATFRFTFGSA